MMPLSFRAVLAVPIGIASMALLLILRLTIHLAAREAVASSRRAALSNRHFQPYENVQVKRPFFLFRADKY
jgi:hypothetical protein